MHAIQYHWGAIVYGYETAQGLHALANPLLATVFHKHTLATS